MPSDQDTSLDKPQRSALLFFIAKEMAKLQGDNLLQFYKRLSDKSVFFSSMGLNEIFIHYTSDQKVAAPLGGQGSYGGRECKALLLPLLNMYPQTTTIIDALGEVDFDYYMSKDRHLLLEL